MMSTELKATKYFEEWVKKEGGMPVQQHGNGYDYEVTWEKGPKKGTKEKYEVKGSTKIKYIPDMRTSEFDNMRLKADFLFVVWNVNQAGEEVVYIIPRDEIKPEHLLLLQTYRLRCFQNNQVMGRFRIK